MALLLSYELKTLVLVFSLIAVIVRLSSLALLHVYLDKYYAS